MKDTKDLDPKQAGHRQRLKQRLETDPMALADYEVLELLLALAIPRRDTKAQAKALMEAAGSLRGALDMRPEELERVRGLGPGAAGLWRLLQEARARYEASPVRKRAVLDGPLPVARMAQARIGALLVEEFWVALLDKQHRLLTFERVGAGTVDQAAVYPREVLALALERKAAALVLVHNHPGGDPTPSPQDLELTRRVAQAAAPLGLAVLDHVVVTDGDYLSFKSHGYLEDV